MNYRKLFSLNNKNIVVTGGCGLIGREIVKGFAEMGGKVIIVDIDKKKGENFIIELKRNKYNSHYIFFDLTELEQIDDFVLQLFNRFGKIDVLVNNAYPKTHDWGNKVEDLKLDSWRKNVDMHLNMYSWLSRSVALKMVEEKIKGSIINIASIYGFLGNDFTVYEGTNMTSPMAYAAIKGGIVNLTRYMAAYFGSYGIRFNNICPGGIFDNQNETFVQNFEKKVPLKKMGLPKDIVGSCIFLGSEASAYVNGHTLVVDGGWSII